jgi:hypothetical protein
MKLIIIAGLVLCAIAILAVVHLRKKRIAGKSKTPTSPQGQVSSAALAAPPVERSTYTAGDDGDDDKYWRRYYR